MFRSEDSHSQHKQYNALGPMPLVTVTNKKLLVLENIKDVHTHRHTAASDVCQGNKRPLKVATGCSLLPQFS